MRRTRPLRRTRGVRLLLALLAATVLSALAATAASASTWCGDASSADRLPQVVGGPSVHLVYAYPSDGTDRLAQFGTTIQTDMETIDAWWRGQDPTRAPRFDTFAFACGPQVDISDVKLTNTGAELTPLDGRFQKIAGALATGGLGSDYEIYVVYYDGPDDGGGVCGQGGTTNPNGGRAYALVFTAGCTAVPTAVTAAHEMTHALGAVTSPAPHECSPPNDGHVCDSDRDLMYPFVNGAPLSDLGLDVGRDDYYGATGVGFDVRTSRWLRHLDEPSAHLSLALTGSGTVASDVPGLQCTAACESDWDGGQTVTLSAAPASGMRFIRWGGACAGTASCTLALSGASAVTALFAPQTFLLTVGVTGRGSVFTSSGTSVCRKRCRLPVTSYQSLALHAVATRGWRFKRWGGACHGTRPVCTVPMTANAAATAVFAKKK